MAEVVAPGARASAGSVIARTALFELRLHLRSPVFWIVVVVTLLMVTGSLTVERIQVGPLRDGTRNTAVGIVYLNLTWSLFFLFTATAFVTDAALRDEATGFGEIVRATPASRRGLAFGRFVGAFGAVLLAFAAVPLAALVAPAIAPEGRLPWTGGSSVAFGFLVLALPNLFMASAVMMMLAATTRSAMTAYLGAVALLVLYGLSAGSGGERADPERLTALLEPFGFGAYVEATAGWSAADRALRLPSLSGILLWNRLVWAGIGVACLAASIGAAAGRARPARSGAARPVEPARSIKLASAPSTGPSHAVPVFGPATVLSQFAARTRLELRLVLGSPVFAVVVLLGLASALVALSPMSLPAWPADAMRVIARLDEAVRLAPIVLAVFYAGDLLWSERDRRVHDLVASQPVPNVALVLPKILAVLATVAATVLASAAAAIVTELLRAGGPIDVPAWLFGYVLPKTFDLALVALLAVFLQSVAPGKLAGFGLMTLYFVASVTLESAGLRSDLYRYGGNPDTLSILRGGSGQAWLVRAYWGSLAFALGAASLLLFGRGLDRPLRVRLADAWRTRWQPAHVAALAGFAGFAILGAVLARQPAG